MRILQQVQANNIGYRVQELRERSGGSIAHDQFQQLVNRYGYWDTDFRGWLIRSLIQATFVWEHLGNCALSSQGNEN
jgi:hypothetical protein